MVTVKVYLIGLICIIPLSDARFRSNSFLLIFPDMEEVNHHLGPHLSFVTYREENHTPSALTVELATKLGLSNASEIGKIYSTQLIAKADFMPIGFDHPSFGPIHLGPVDQFPPNYSRRKNDYAFAYVANLSEIFGSNDSLYPKDRTRATSKYVNVSLIVRNVKWTSFLLSNATNRRNDFKLFPVDFKNTKYPYQKVISYIPAFEFRMKPVDGHLVFPYISNEGVKEILIPSGAHHSIDIMLGNVFVGGSSSHSVNHFNLYKLIKMELPENVPKHKLTVKIDIVGNKFKDTHEPSGHGFVDTFLNFPVGGGANPPIDWLRCPPARFSGIEP